MQGALDYFNQEFLLQAYERARLGTYHQLSRLSATATSRSALGCALGQSQLSSLF